ncbi:MAG: murein biosynthesis integral membrane protein MurJ [Pseudomonadota bacterium]
MRMAGSSTTRDDHRQIASGAGGLAIATFASRALGLVRDTIIASLFTAFQTDCFFLALTIPNVLRRILGEGAINAAVVPVYTDFKEKEAQGAVQAFLQALWGTSATVLGSIAFIGALASPLIVFLYAYGFASLPEKFNLTVNLNRIMFPYIFFIGLTAISAGILNVHRKFFAPALSPSIWNAAVIVFALLLPVHLASCGVDTVYALAAGVMAGGLLQVFYQAILQAGTRTLPAPRIDFRNPGIRKIGRLMAPLLAGFGLYQLDVVLSRLFASFLPEGSVSYLYYGMRLVEFPQGVIFLSLATASLPLLSRLATRGELETLKQTFERTLSLTFFLSIPAAVALTVMARAAICVVFFRGAFDLDMFEPTWMALSLMAPGILGTAGIRITTPVFYAFKDTRTPVVVAGTSLAIYIVSCLALMFPFKHLGLAAALAIAPTSQFIILFILLRRKIGGLKPGRLLPKIGRFSLAAAGMALVMLMIQAQGDWESGGNSLRNILVLLAETGAGLFTYLALTWIMGAREISLMLGLLRKERKSR